nr:rhomboid family intramembrane serine protease [Stackebrandtia endophytica]
MNQASVGFQCPECVAEGRKSIRQPRTAFGGSMRGHAGMVTKALIGVNVGVFLIGLVMTAFMGGPIVDVIMGAPTELHIYGAVYPGPLVAMTDGSFMPFGIANGEYHRLFTAMFLHYGIIHLAFNMYVLWIFGRFLERDLGPARFLALYLVCGIGGNVATYLFAAEYGFSAGASGSIFGLFGAVLLINRKLSRDNSGIYVLLGLNLVITFMVPNISITGHLGGLVTGLALGWALSAAPKESRNMVQISAFVATLALFAAAVVWRTGALIDAVSVLA